MKVNLKKAFNTKRIILVLIVLVLVVVMVISNPDVKEFFTKTESVKLNFQTGVEYDMVNYGKEMLLVNNEGIYAIDKMGRESWSVVSAATSPYAETSGKYIMLADMNGKTIKTFQKEKLIAQIETKNEILCSKVNKNGYVAVATDELGYKGKVMLFDKSGKEQYVWHSGTGYIGDIDISPNNKVAVAQLMTDKESVYSKILLLDTKSDKEPTLLAEVSGIVMKLKYWDNGELIAVSDSGLYGYKRSGKKKFEVDFSGRKPIMCNIENERNMVIAFDSGLNSTVLESYSSNGKLRGSYDSGSEVKAIDISGECIALANREGIVRINPRGVIKNKVKTSKDVKDIKIFEGRDKLLSLGDNNAELIRIR